MEEKIWNKKAAMFSKKISSPKDMLFMSSSLVANPKPMKKAFFIDCFKEASSWELSYMTKYFMFFDKSQSCKVGDCFKRKRYFNFFLNEKKERKFQN